MHVCNKKNARQKKKALIVQRTPTKQLIRGSGVKSSKQAKQLTVINSRIEDQMSTKQHNQEHK